MKISPEDFQKEIIDIKEKIVIVKFFADGCKPCADIDITLEQINKNFKNKIKIYKINTEKNIELSKLLNIDGLPTLLLFKNGKKLKKLIGSVSYKTIEKEIGRIECLNI